MTLLFQMNLGFAWGAVTGLSGPVYMVAGEVYLPGVQDGDAYLPGVQDGEAYIPGVQDGESTSDN